MKNKELESKEMKNPIPMELGDDALDKVSGGEITIGTCRSCGLRMAVYDSHICPKCGATMETSISYGTIIPQIVIASAPPNH